MIWTEKQLRKKLADVNAKTGSRLVLVETIWGWRLEMKYGKEGGQAPAFAPTLSEEGRSHRAYVIAMVLEAYLMGCYHAIQEAKP